MIALRAGLEGGAVDDVLSLGMVQACAAYLDILADVSSDATPLLLLGVIDETAGALSDADLRGGDDRPYPGWLAGIEDPAGPVLWYGGALELDVLDAGSEPPPTQVVIPPITPIPGSDRAVFVQAQAAATWTISHPFPNLPTVMVIDSTGEQVWATVLYPTPSTISIQFSAPLAGTAYLN